MTLISVCVPTIPGRRKDLEQLERSLVRSGGDIELIVANDSENWGKGINAAAEKATGDYLFLASDDHEVLPGWWEAAAEICDQNLLPAPKMFNTDRSLQSCGLYNVEQPDGEITEFPRVPFLSRAQWELLGPLLPIHFADVYLGKKARLRGIETIVCHGYQLIHHMVATGRRDYEDDEKARLELEEAIGAPLDFAKQ